MKNFHSFLQKHFELHCMPEVRPLYFLSMQLQLTKPYLLPDANVDSVLNMKIFLARHSLKWIDCLQEWIHT